MSIKVYYAKLNNMGDLLNEYLIPAVTGKAIEHCENVANFDVMGIGSCGGAIWRGKKNTVKDYTKDIVKSAMCFGDNNPCAVWGTGFIEDLSDCRNLKLIRQSTEFIALRGNLTKATVEKALGRKINPVLCDGGILSPLIVAPSHSKKYKVGLIPHFYEMQIILQRGIVSAFQTKYQDGIIINLKEDPLTVLRQISECEVIISSSLHGCVVADSYSIPNIRVRFSDIPGTGYKFDDYYSGYGLEVHPVKVCRFEDMPTVYEVAEQYQIIPHTVEEKKQAMADCLSQFIRKLKS